MMDNVFILLHIITYYCWFMSLRYKSLEFNKYKLLLNLKTEKDIFFAKFKFINN